MQRTRRFLRILEVPLRDDEDPHAVLVRFAFSPDGPARLVQLIFKHVAASDTEPKRAVMLSIVGAQLLDRAPEDAARLLTLGLGRHPSREASALLRNVRAASKARVQASGNESASAGSERQRRNAR